MRWGLIPHWAKDIKIGYKMINAKAETLAEKPAYRTAYKKRRCLIFAGVIGGMALILLLIHLLYSPLDVLWFRGLRKVDSLVGG